MLKSPLYYLIVLTKCNEYCWSRRLSFACESLDSLLLSLSVSVYCDWSMGVFFLLVRVSVTNGRGWQSPSGVLWPSGRYWRIVYMTEVSASPKNWTDWWLLEPSSRGIPSILLSRERVTSAFFLLPVIESSEVIELRISSSRCDSRARTLKRVLLYLGITQRQLYLNGACDPESSGRMKFSRASFDFDDPNVRHRVLPTLYTGMRFGLVQSEQGPICKGFGLFHELATYQMSVHLQAHCEVL